MEPSPPQRAAYAELLRDLFARRRFGIDLGLERVARVADGLGWDDSIPVVRVAGTNGKGSTCAFIDWAARSAGVRVGRFSSPHLCRFTERFAVDGAEVSESKIIDAAARVRRAGGDELTFFELATAMALAIFSEAAVDLAVLEVGLGGRLDATRAVSAEVSAVTRVALEHQSILGDTVEAIALEKAGTFEAGKAAIVGGNGSDALDQLLVTAAADIGASPIVLVREPCRETLGLRGRFQRHNAAVAWAILEELARRRIIPLDREAWRLGLADTRLPGRLERLREGPCVVVDGAHNPDAALALAEELPRLGRRVLVVLALSSDKDAAGVVRPIAEVADELWVTKSRHPRAMPVAVLAAHVPGARRADGVAQALAAAVRSANPDDAVVVCGSLFAAGEARAHLTGERCDPADVTDP